MVAPKQSDVHAKAGIHLQRGFSLVELSIVLVILGLLVGGVLAGQSLIRAAELRSISTEYSRWTTSAQTFRDKYFALPGDMTNATAFWGKDAAACNADSGTVSTPGSCNGNGNGFLDQGVTAGGTTERHRFWQQLALAGLIEGTFTGNAGPGGSDEALLNINVPASKLRNAGWATWSTQSNFSDGATYLHNYGNTLLFGSPLAGSKIQQPAISTEEAWNIDTKMDDGMPGTGNIIGRSWGTCASATGVSDYAAPYRLSSTGIRCALQFKGFI